MGTAWWWELSRERPALAGARGSGGAEPVSGCPGPLGVQDRAGLAEHSTETLCVSSQRTAFCGQWPAPSDVQMGLGVDRALLQPVGAEQGPQPNAASWVTVPGPRALPQGGRVAPFLAALCLPAGGPLVPWPALRFPRALGWAWGWPVCGAGRSAAPNCCSWGLAATLTKGFGEQGVGTQPEACLALAGSPR